MRALYLLVLLALLSSAAMEGLGQAGSSDTAGSATIRHLLDGAQFAEAMALARDFADRERETRGASSLEFARALDLLVEARLGAGKAIARATLELANQAVEIKEHGAAKDLGTSLTNLGRLYIDRGEPGVARPVLDRAIATHEAAYGADHPSLITALRNLGTATKALGELETAEAAYRREGELITLHRGPEHIDLAANSYNTAWLMIDLGDFVEAERLFESARRIVEKAHGPESPRMVWVLLGLGGALDLQGDHSRSIAVHEKALRIARDTLGPEHPMVGSCETGLGSALMHLGDYREAEAALLRALEVTEKTYGSDHENTGRTLRTLAEAASELDDAASADAYLERAIEIFGHAGADYLRLDTSVLAARRLAQQGARTEAIRQLEEVLVAARELMPGHLDLVTWELALGEELLDAGRYGEAIASFQTAIRQSELVGATEDSAYISSLVGQATGHARSGDHHRALDVAVRAEELSMTRTRLLAGSLPERQALRLSEERPSSLGLLVTLAAATGDSDNTTAAWRAVTRSRASVLDEITFRRRLANSGHLDREVVREYDAASGRLANLMVQGVSGRDSALFRSLLAAARVRREVAERELALASDEYRLFARDRRVDLSDVLAAIPADSALLALTFYRRDKAAYPEQAETSRHAREHSEFHYLAFVAGGSDEEARAIPLGPATEIDRAVEEWRLSILDGLASASVVTENAYRKTARRLSELLWDPLGVNPTEFSRLFVVPDGHLSLVSFAALPTGETGYLGERLSVHYLSAETDLAVRASEPLGSGLLAVGGAAYDETALLVAPESSVEPIGNSPLRGGIARADVGWPSGACQPFGEVRFSELVGAAAEARAIARRWDRLAPDQWGPALRLSGRNASETRFKRDATGKRVLHLATHGFFHSGSCSTPASKQRGIGGITHVGSKGVPATERTENALRLSGLAFAGANHRSSALPSEDDGILTALEIAALDLTGVEWAVLSGCDTGVGDVRAGEGVFGLRRAFQSAGARTLVMSLWPVQDEAAAEWMTALYEARLVQRASAANSVARANRAVLERRRSQGVSTHPALWAGFVASGDWG